MERAQILRRLEVKLANAREWRDRARREFDANITVGTGIGHTCGGLAVHNSGREYERAMRAANRALIQHTDFIVKGTISEDLNLDVNEEPRRRSAP